MKRTFFLNFVTRPLTAGVSLLLLLSACQSAPNSGEAASGEAASGEAASGEAASPAAEGGDGALKLGTVLPITGDLAQYGGPMQDSASLLVETVNACGGALGQPVQLISEDDQTEPSAGAAAMTKLAEVDRVGGVVGAAASSVSSAIVDIAVRNKVMQISPASTSPVFTERAEKGDFDGFWARTAPPDTYQGDALAQLAQQQGFKNVAILAINNDYGNGLTQSFTTAFEKLGGTVVNKSDPVRYAPDATTFDSEVTSAFSQKPDAVMLVAYPETGSIILKAAQEQGLLDGNTKILLTDGMKTGDLANLVGKTGDGSFIATGVLGTAPSAGGPGFEQFNRLYRAKFSDRAPAVYDPNTWDATALLVLAAEAAKSNTGEAIRDKLREVASGGEKVTDVCQALEQIRAGQDIDFDGASGSLDLNENGDVTGTYDVWTIADDGSLKVQSKITVGGS